MKKKIPKHGLLAKELHEAGVAHIRKIEGYDDGQTWSTASARTKNGMIGIAKYVLKNWQPK